MNNKIVLLAGLFVVSQIATAENLLEGIAKQVATDAVMTAAPDAAAQAQAAAQVLEQAQALKNAATTAPDLLKQQALGAAKQKLADTANVMAPGTVQKLEAAKQALNQAKALKGAVANAPDALKQQAVGVAKQQLADTANAMAPGAAQKLEAAKQALDQAKALKGAVANAPDALKQQAAQAAKAKIQEEATKGLVDLLR